MKRNVTLFSLLALLAFYILYENEEKHTSLKDVQIESASLTPDESETRIYHTRKLLSLSDTRNKLQKVDSVWAAARNSLEETNGAQLELLGKEPSQNTGKRNNKFSRRRKRRAPNPEQFAWKFNLNVTRYENNGTTNNPVAYPTPVEEKRSKSDERYLGMAMSVSGNGPNQSVEDLYKAWDSVGQFLRTLFGGNLEELKDKGHGVSVDVSSSPNGTIGLPHELFLEGSGEEESQESRNRTGKFLLGIFGLGGNKENPPRDEGSGDVMDIQEFDETDSVDLQIANETKDIKELSTLETLSNDGISSVPAFTSTKINLKESATSSLIVDEFSTTMNTKISPKLTSTSSIEETLSVGECTDCKLQTATFIPTDDKIPTEQNTTSLTFSDTITTNFELNDEALKGFCSALFSRMRTSGRSVEVSENLEGSGSFEIEETNFVSVSNVNTHASIVLTDKPRPQNLGFFESIWNRIVGRKVPPIKEDIPIESRGARLINFGNLFGGFGSGRSVDSGENSNIEFDNFDAGLTGNTEDDEQFLLDCEEFLRSVQTESRPNIFDLVNPQSVESLTTELTTQVSEDPHLNQGKDDTTLKEIFIIPTSKPDNLVLDQTSSIWLDSQLTTQPQDNHLEENKSIKHFTETTQLNNLVFTEVQGTAQSHLSVQNLVMENTESQNVPTTETLANSVLTNVIEIELTTKESNVINLNEDRSFNVFGFGSGIEEGSSDISNANERFFGGLINFGSGSREIKEIDISPEDNRDTTESSKERSFGGFFNFGSGEREIKEMVISTEQTSDETTENSEERSFGGFFSFGSGEREIKVIASTEQSSEKTTVTSKERSFSFNDFGSGARELVNPNSSTLEESTDLPTSTISNEGRIFGLNLGFGSGERQLSEPSDLVTGQNETELLLFPFTEDNMIPREPLNTSLFPVEITEQSILRNTNVPFEEYERGEIFTEANEIPDKRSFGLNIFGSGDSRELTSEFTNTEDINCLDCLSKQNTTECDGCEDILNDTESFASDISTVFSFVEDDIAPENLCFDCEITNLPIMPEDSSIPVSILDEKLPSTDVLSFEDKTFENGLELVTNMVQPPFSTKKEDSSSAAITEITLGSTTEKNKSRFLGTIFLTGSGDSGLFVDNKGPINLVEESEFTSPVFQQSLQSRRGARKHDIVFEKPKEIFEPTVTTPFQSTSESHFITSQSQTDKNNLNTFVTEANNETESNSLFLEVNDEIVTSVGTVEPERVITTVPSELAKVTITSTPTLPSAISVPDSVTTIGVKVSTVLNINPRSKITELPQRFCTSASQCNRALNERCIFDGPEATCNCGRSYVRSPETGKCESPVVLKTSLKLPGEVFHHDLKNRNSSRFQKMANDSIETMWILLGDDPDLFRIVAGVSVSSFEEGSLVVNWEITLAAPENESVAQLIEQVDAELKEAFEDEELLRRAPLNVHNAVLVAVTNDIDPCEKTELNYCSKNADCNRDPIRGFKCSCKDDYLDQSTNMNHPGEICIATCPPYYCGDHGECNLKQNGDRHCSCNSWYFGEKCEISGIVVIAGFASFNILLIIIVLVLVCYCRKRRYRQRFYNQNRVRFQPEAELGRFTASPRLADTIALGDVGPTKASKYMAISTPMRNTPDIRLTSPSILGGSATPYSKDLTNNYRKFARSSVDYDYDSTFDRTPSVEEINVEVHKSGTTPKA